MNISTEPLQKAHTRLKEGLIRYQADITDEQIRDGLIQRFEFTYELAHKTIKRYLEQTSPSPNVFDAMSFADIIRSANEMGLLAGDWSDWRTYREMRNLTSHTYDENKAILVVNYIPAFIVEITFLLNELDKRLNHG